MNYARCINGSPTRKKGDLVFCTLTPPIEPQDYHLWAFWFMPDGERLETFNGFLIGETPTARAERLGHGKEAPKPPTYRSNN